MKPIIQCIGACVLLWQSDCRGADDVFYDQVIACIGTNKGPGSDISAAALLDTNNMAPELAGSAMERIKLRPRAEVAGICPGMKMGQVVAAWGKPQRMWIYCDGSPQLCYRGQGHRDVRVTVDLAANTVTNIWLTFPTVGGSTSTKPRVEDCIRLFGEPTVRSISPEPLVARKQPPEHWRCRMVFEAAQANMILYFEDEDLLSLEIESRPSSVTGKK